MTGRILHLTDIHFGCENKAAVQAVLELALRESFAFTAVTGDVTQAGLQHEFDAAAESTRTVSCAWDSRTAPFDQLARIWMPRAVLKAQAARPSCSWATVHAGPKARS